MYTGFVQRGLPRSSPKNAAAPLYHETTRHVVAWGHGAQGGVRAAPRGAGSGWCAGYRSVVHLRLRWLAAGMRRSPDIGHPRGMMTRRDETRRDEPTSLLYHTTLENRLGLCFCLVRNRSNAMTEPVLFPVSQNNIPTSPLLSTGPSQCTLCNRLVVPFVGFSSVLSWHHPVVTAAKYLGPRRPCGRGCSYLPYCRHKARGWFSSPAASPAR